MVIKNDYQPLKVHMGRTLLVSGVGLLLILVSTLILVPANGFWMNKKLGAGLILAYTVSPGSAFRESPLHRLADRRLPSLGSMQFCGGHPDCLSDERLCRDLVVKQEEGTSLDSAQL